MSRERQLLNRAIQLAAVGKQEDARRLLLAVIQGSPRNEDAWLRYIETWVTLAERRRAYEQWLQADPSNQRARQTLAQMQNVHPWRRLPLESRPALFLLAIVIVCMAIVLMGTSAYTWNNRYQVELNELQGRHEALVARAQVLQQA